MKQLKLFLLYSVLIFSIFSFASLGRFYTNEPVKAGDELEVLATVKNPTGSTADDVSLRVFIYDLGIMLNSNPFDVSKESSAVGRIYWTVPSGTSKGTYLAKLEVSNDRFRDWQHTYITIA